MSRFKYIVVFIACLIIFFSLCLNEIKLTISDGEYQVAYEIWVDSENANEVPYIEVNDIKYFRFDSLDYNCTDKKTAKPLYGVVQRFDDKSYETNKHIYGYQHDAERSFLHYDMGDVDISPVSLYYRSDLKGLEVNEKNVNEVKIIALGNSNYHYSIVTKETIKLFLSVRNSNVNYTKQEQLFKQILKNENILKISDYQSEFKIVALLKDYPYLEFTLGFIRSDNTGDSSLSWHKLTNMGGAQPPPIPHKKTFVTFCWKVNLHSEGCSPAIKTVNGVAHEYYYTDGQLTYEKVGDEYELFYFYDDNGSLVMIFRQLLATKVVDSFYPICNTRGDLKEIRNAAGQVIVRYNYDAWGKITSITDKNGASVTADHFANQISVRYRGYVYDKETGLYYLQSRYYDPETGRFLNADDVKYIGYSGEQLSYNAFAYCENNAVVRVDTVGYTFKSIFNKLYNNMVLNFLIDRINKIGGLEEPLSRLYEGEISFKIEDTEYTDLKKYTVRSITNRYGNFMYIDFYYFYVGTWYAWYSCLKYYENNSLYKFYNSVNDNIPLVAEILSVLLGVRYSVFGYILSAKDLLIDMNFSELTSFIRCSRAMLDGYNDNKNRDALFIYIEKIVGDIFIYDILNGTTRGHSILYQGDDGIKGV